MMTVRRAEQRRHESGRTREVWHTFVANERADPLSHGFGILEMLNEERLGPGAAAPARPRHDAEVLTCVHDGALSYEDSLGGSGVLYAGEVQRMTAGRGVRHGERNASRAEAAHLFQIWLRPCEAELAPSRERKRFSTAERRGVLCAIASPDGRRGSLRVLPDALVYSALLDPGQHTVHALSEGRSAWLHIVRGSVALADVVLTTGDGIGVTAERTVSFTAREETEVLLLDLGPLPQAQRIGNSPSTN
jgi:quercetin 2,3-dioxygenase